MESKTYRASPGVAEGRDGAITNIDPTANTENDMSKRNRPSHRPREPDLRQPMLQRPPSLVYMGAAALIATAPYLAISLMTPGCSSSDGGYSSPPMVKFVESNLLTAIVEEGRTDVELAFYKAMGTDALVWAIDPYGEPRVVFTVEEPSFDNVIFSLPVLQREDVVEDQDDCWCGGVALQVDLKADTDGALIDNDRTVLSGVILDWEALGVGGGNDTGCPVGDEDSDYPGDEDEPSDTGTPGDTGDTASSSSVED